jgi:hypothetical protein
LEEIQRQLSRVTVYGGHRNLQVDWQLFKQSGTIEHFFGDIALVTTISYQDRDSLEGVAFLEAKKRYIGTTSFDAMKQNQLELIDQSVENAMVLLYDYEDISQYASLMPSVDTGEWFPWKPCTHSVVVPLKTVVKINKDDTSLYKFSLPFSYQLFFRYFNGFDLDFTESSLSLAKGFADKKPLPRYVDSFSGPRQN